MSCWPVLLTITLVRRFGVCVWGLMSMIRTDSMFLILYTACLLTANRKQWWRWRQRRWPIRQCCCHQRSTVMEQCYFWFTDARLAHCYFVILSYHIISYIIIIIDLKWQNHFRVLEQTGLSKRSRCSLSHMIRWRCPDKTSWKATIWAGNERCIQTEKMLHLLAGGSRSLGQQPGKHGYW